MPLLSKMSVYEFGKRLLELNDLDPVYVVLHNADLTSMGFRRWLLAYWCYYHVGTASWIVDQPDYWVAMRTAIDKTYPRSSERRHFRGDNAEQSIAYLERRGSAALFDDLKQCGTSSRQVIDVVKSNWVGFGPWIAFKIADMLERLGIQQLGFDTDTAMYEGSPTEGAHHLWETEHDGEGPFTKGHRETEWAVERILSSLGSWDAPPSGDRKINVQEVETILCKWFSYTKGHYEIGEDIAAVRTGLLRFGKCRTSQRLLVAGKKGGLWK